MPVLEVLLLAADLVELHQQVDVGRRAGRRKAWVARFVMIRRAQAVSSAAAFGVQTKILRRLGESFAGVGVERPFDADRADVREERVARRRARSARRAHEVLIEIEQRREVASRGTWRRPCACRPWS